MGVKKCVAGFAGRRGLRGSLGMVEFGVAYAAAGKGSDSSWLGARK